MKLLIVSATTEEIKPLLSFLGIIVTHTPGMDTVNYTHHIIDVVITKPGIMHTSFQLGSLLAKNKYDLALNAGICGSLHKDIAIGDVIIVTKDRVGDFGKLSHGFKDIFEMGFVGDEDFPYKAGWLESSLTTRPVNIDHLKKVKGVTVNKGFGVPDEMIKKYNPDIESMEGAAFFYACLVKEIPCIQIRAISNYVPPDTKHNWDIPKAIEQLNNQIIHILQELR